MSNDLADRVGEGGDLAQSLDHAVDARLVQFQPVQQGCVQALGGAGLQVLAILRYQVVAYTVQIVCHGMQGGVLGRGAGGGEGA